MWYDPTTWFQGNNKSTGLERHSHGAPSFFSYNGKEIYFNLDNELNYRAAYIACAPLKAIINKRAQFFVNGEVEIVSNSTGNKKRGPVANLLRDKLRKPNVLQSWKQFFAQFHIYIDIFGYCPVFKVEPVGMEGQGIPSALWCLPPWLFDIKYTGKWREQNELKGIYKEFSLKWAGEDRVLDMDNVSIVLDNSIGTDDDANFLIPDSRIKSNEYEISNFMSAMKARNTLITKKGAIGILSNVSKDPSGPIPMQPGQKEEVQQDFARYGLTGQEWQVIVTDASLSWQSMTVPVKELMLHEEVESTIMRLCDGMGLHYDLLAKLKASTFNNLEEAKKAQYQDFIIPDAQARIEQLSFFILPPELNSHLEISYAHLEILQQSLKEASEGKKAQGEAMKILWELGLVTRNMMLLEVGLDPVLDRKEEFDIYNFEVKPPEPEPGQAPFNKPKPDVAQ